MGLFLLAQFGKLLRNAFHVGQHIFLLARIAQEIGRMINGSHQIVPLWKPFSMLLGDAEIGLDETRRRDATQADNDLWAQQAHLLAQIADAGILLGRQHLR